MQHPSPPRSLLRYALPAALTAILALHVLLCSQYKEPADDAFITLRYAKNLLAGHGLVWNPGENPPVEGYSNPLFLLLVAGGGWLGLDFLGWAIAINLLASLGTLALVYHLTRRLLPRAGLWALAPPLLLALNGSFQYWVSGALETHLYTLLVTLLAVQLVSEQENPTLRKEIFVGATFLAMALTRPESPALFLLWIIYILLNALSDRTPGLLKRRVFQTAPAFLVFALGLGLVLLFRWCYYGDLLPNTSYAKTGGGISQFLRGLRYVRDAFWMQGGFMVPCLALLSFPALPRRAWPVFLLTLALIAGTVAVGGDGLFWHRFLVPAQPLLAVLAIFALASWHRAAAASNPQSGPLGALLVRASAPALVLLLAILPQCQPWIVRPSLHDLRDLPVRVLAGEYPPLDGSLLEHCRRDVEFLSRTLPPGEWIACNGVGRIGFFANRPILDMLGLNDRHIARKVMPNMGKGIAGHEKHDARYVLSRRPGIVILGFDPIQKKRLPLKGDIRKDWKKLLFLPGDLDLLRLPQFRTDYEPEIVPLSGGFGFHLFRRKDLAPLSHPVAVQQRVARSQ